MEKENRIYRKKLAQDFMDVARNRESYDKVSMLNMPCCDRFLKWNGSGLEGLMAEASECPLCGANLGEVCGAKGPVEG